MHSKIIASLLDTNGKHYQENLFLKKFLEVVGITDFDTKSSKIEIEKSGKEQKDGRIDIYLTDGKKHIIIENKINAEEQKNQIQRYVEIVYQNIEDINHDDIWILYLSKNGKKPTSRSLGNLEINTGFLMEKEDKKAKFKVISYKKDIVNWLNKCIKEVENLSNLKESLKIYKEVVEKITKQYRQKGVAMSEFLIQNLDCVENAYILHENFSKAMAKVANKFLKGLEKYSELECVNSKISDKNIVYDSKKLESWFDNKKNIGSFFKINEEWLLFFWFGKKNFHIGVIPFIEENNKFKLDNENIEKLEIFKNLKNYIKKGEKRDRWATLSENCCFTINYGDFKNRYNKNLVECIELDECEIKKDIQEILEFFAKL
jgi:hypothetical protein